MRVFVTGSTGVLGRAAIASLLADGHEVTGLARNEAKAAEVEAAGAEAVEVHLFDPDEMAAVLRGHEAVCNLATHVPVGLSGMRRGAWKLSDRLRTEGSRVVAAAAAAAGVRRLVQESVSLLYADGGDEWLTEGSPLAVTGAVEPAAVAESNAAGFESPAHAPVTLRFGQIVGDDAMTRWRLAQARSGRPIGLGDPDGWAHVVHAEDAGRAVAAALAAPAGVYNVGADPVRRSDFTHAFGEAVGAADVGFVPRLVVKVAGERLEPWTRSQRVSSDLFHEVTGWKPTHHVFDASWLHEAAGAR